MRRERKKKGVNGGWVGGEKRMEGREVFGGDDDGDGESSDSKLVGEVKKRKKMTLSRVWEYEDVRLRHGCFTDTERPATEMEKLQVAERGRVEDLLLHVVLYLFDT